MRWDYGMDRADLIKTCTTTIIISIAYDNFESEQLRSQFQKQILLEVNFQGTTNDYDSLMYYMAKARFSERDVIQLNCMYNCPGSGVAGILRVHVRYGRELRNSYDLLFPNDSDDPYVTVTAVDDSAKRTTLQTQIIHGNKNPSWNAWLDFGGRKAWQYMEIIIRDKDLIFDDTVIATQSFLIHPGYHRVLQHCNNAQCSRRLVFDYSLILDGKECGPNRCVRGTCTDLISDYRCNCPSGYGGKRCESRVGIISGRLRIYARYGTEVPAVIEIVDYLLAIVIHMSESQLIAAEEAQRVCRQVSVYTNDGSPEWNQWLDFGVDRWTRLTVQVYDEDGTHDSSLSSLSTYHLSS